MPAKEHLPALERRILELAETQNGRVTRSQLLALGLGRGAILHRLHSGRLIAARRGVYTLGVGPETPEARWLTAVLACPLGTVLSHLSAAALWSVLRADPPVIDVSTPHRSGTRRDGIRLHRPLDLPEEEVTEHRGVPVTSVGRTLMDIATVVSARTLERALDEAEFLGLVDALEIQQLLERHAGTPGAARLAKVLERHRPGSTRTRSPLEEAFFTLVISARLPRPEVNVSLAGYTVDFLWRDHGLVVETDGRASHDRLTQRERDSRRDAVLSTAGFRTERYTWTQVTRRPEEVLSVLRSLLQTG